MHSNIFAEKQVGQVSYCVGSLERLISIIDSQCILASRKPEVNPQNHKKMYYVSFSRNLTAACKRNPNRWYCGVIVDGTKLSNRYPIVPYSFAAANLNEGKNLAVKGLTAYENGTYKLTLVNWPTIDIPKSVYDKVKQIIEDFPQNDKRKLQHTGKGTRRVGGTYISEKYVYNVKHGGPRLNSELLGETGITLSKHTVMNETEERIWLNSDTLINIRGCISGIILPKSLERIFENPKSTIENEFVKCVKSNLPNNFKVVTY